MGASLLQGPPGTKGDKGHSGPSGLVVSMDLLRWQLRSSLLGQGSRVLYNM
jgi:hypothetical protein